MAPEKEWTIMQAVALWSGVTLVVIEGEVLLASLLGHAYRLVGGVETFTQFIGPMWPLLILTSLLAVSTTLPPTRAPVPDHAGPALGSVQASTFPTHLHG